MDVLRRVGIYYETETEGTEYSARYVEMLKDLSRGWREDYLLAKRSGTTETAYRKILVKLALTYEDCITTRRNTRAHANNRCSQGTR